ncbi:hypothetical protein OAE12_01270 [bacterium]|nr:hypothetical protein [bacterium]
MKRFVYILISTLLVLVACQEKKSGFNYDPTVPYPLLNSGDFWIDKFDQRGLQNAIIYRDRLYCNTIDVGGDANYLYCLNPQNGLVEWRANVEAYASQSAAFLDSIIIYSSYLGNISAFNEEGKNLWKAKFSHPYGGHWVDTLNSKLLVKTVYWKHVSEYDIKSGNLISDKENDSLQLLIEENRKDKRLLETHIYNFTRNGTTYKINCRPSKTEEWGDYKIETKVNTANTM